MTRTSRQDAGCFLAVMVFLIAGCVFITRSPGFVLVLLGVIPVFVVAAVLDDM